MSITLQCVHPVLMSSDLLASTAFYQRLGFTLSFQDHPTAPRYAVVERDGVSLHLQWHDKAEWSCGHDRPTYRFVVQDVDGLYRAFRESGAISTHDPAPGPWAAPGDTPWDTREFHLRDPDGNGLQFYWPR